MGGMTITAEAAPKAAFPGFEMKPLAEATREEVARYAAIMAGIAIEDGDDKNAIVVKLSKAGMKPENIAIIPEVLPSGTQALHKGPIPRHSIVEHPTEKVEDDKGRKVPRKYVNINVHVDPRPGGDRPFPCSVNGRLMYITRGENISVPIEYVEVLQNAVETVYEPSRTPEGGLGEARHVPSYPFSFI